MGDTTLARWPIFLGGERFHSVPVELVILDRTQGQVSVAGSLASARQPIGREPFVRLGALLYDSRGPPASLFCRAMVIASARLETPSLERILLT